MKLLYLRARCERLNVSAASICFVSSNDWAVNTLNHQIGNADMHLKNWPLIYPDGRKQMVSDEIMLRVSFAGDFDSRSAVALVRDSVLLGFHVRGPFCCFGIAHIESSPNLNS